VEDAENGRTGLQKLLELQPDLALIDVGLPDVDGYELVRAARACAEGRRLYLVALTGYSQPDDRRRATEAGFDIVLAKPVDWQALDRILTTASGAPRARS
jgi:CheY-like chemotaxis protein